MRGSSSASSKVRLSTASGGPSPRPSAGAALVFAALVLLAGYGVKAPLQGQVPNRDGEPPPTSASAVWSGPEGTEGWWKGWVGIPEPDRVYGGLWALHLRRPGDGLSSHHLIAGTYRGIHAGTFVNTHEGRSWMIALGRSVVVAEEGRTAFRLGYRIGLLGGYDEQLMDLADRWPVLPAGKLVADARYRRLGFQIGWSWIVVTFGGFVEVGSR